MGTMHHPNQYIYMGSATKANIMGSAAMCLMIIMRFLLSLSSFAFPVVAVSSYSFSLSPSSSSAASSMQQDQHPLVLCHDSERSALLQFKQGFLVDQECAPAHPSDYPKIATWKSSHDHDHDHDCCSWDGVECDRETGHVIGLHLPSSCLFGSINSTSTLFDLLHLRSLDLSDNHFNYSQIPSAVGQLSRLTSLNLSIARFSGQIPSELIFALSKLVSLDLSGNPLLKLQKPGLRDVVQSLTHLEALHLSQVNISSTIPHELANLSSLTSLLLKNCGLHGEFPTNIFRLPSLQYVSVRYNEDLTGYLPEFEEGSPLRMLYLAGTSFSGELPSSIGRLTSLTWLDLGSCNFTGTVPSSLGHLPQLSYLDLSYNSFSAQIPSSFANLTLLTLLDLSFNNLEIGTHQAWLGQQTKLTVLDLGQTNLRGEIPSSLANMSQLSVLSLHGNQLSGQIPSRLMNLTRLIQLDLHGNKLEGSIPSSLFELVNLVDLNLADNQLRGTVELHMFSKFKNLSSLQLSANKLSLLTSNNTNATFPKLYLLGLEGCNLIEFPGFLRNQDELEVLFLSRNKIRGSIPKWVWSISKETLATVDLSRNFLTGFDQPPLVLSWSNLHRLSLVSNMLQGSLPIPPPSTIQYLVSRNKLSGPIPPLVCTMTSLQVLDLSGNNLSGHIPPCLTNFSKSLRVLDLGSNNFSGPIPETCTRMPNVLEVLDLGENQFQGRVPKSLANCMMLEDLVLGNNQIDDSFPFWLGALPRLEVLILRSNRFHGAIRRRTTSDMTSFRFPKLRIIDLSENEFMGDLPSEYFQNWDAMKNTNVSNHLVYMQANTTYEESGGHLMNFAYAYSMTITNKGMQRLFYEVIPDTLMAIDLSGNKFRGQIPASIGRLQGLHMLNLGRNNLSGPIPSSLGNLTQLESLDLSGNKLSGEIPWQLTSLTFLEFFNVSDNHLTGPIPQGKQFATFPNDSFDGNPGLCGPPLSSECEGPPPPTPNSSSSEQEGSKLDWKFAVMGYATGLVIGVSIGYCFTTWKHEWFVKTFGKPQRYISKWTRTERMGLRS